MALLQDELLDIEALDWAMKIRQIVQRLRYYIEDDSANILNFFQVGCNLQYISDMYVSLDKIVTYFDC